MKNSVYMVKVGDRYLSMDAPFPRVRLSGKKDGSRMSRREAISWLNDDRVASIMIEQPTGTVGMIVRITK